MSKKNDYKETETYKRWNSIREVSPVKAYGLLTIAVARMGWDAASSGMQSIRHAITNVKEGASNSTKAIAEEFNKVNEDINHHNPTSDKFQNRNIREIENEFKNK